MCISLTANTSEMVNTTDGYSVSSYYPCLLYWRDEANLKRPDAIKVPDGHWVGGYYSSWSYWRGGSGLKSLDAIKAQSGAANFINYAFLGVTTNAILNNPKPAYGGITLPASAQGPAGTILDIEALADNLDGSCPGDAGDPKWCAASHVYQYLKKYRAASDNQTILMASIGGWSYTPRFTEFYQDYKKDHSVLTTFYDSTINWLKNHPDFGGIDIDWEYPGLGHEESPSCKHAGEGKLYTEMFAGLRQKLGSLNGKHYYLTAAIVSSVKKAKDEVAQGVDFKSISNSVDWFNLMSFDIHGEFDAAQPATKAKALSMSDPDELQNVIDYYLNTGIPPNKILLGLPAYAREMLVKNQPSKDNNYGYKGDLHYDNYENYYKAFSKEYYSDNKAYFDYQDNPNIEPYYPVGGMVDFTGIYDYQCFLSDITNGLAQSKCNVLSPMDNRGNVGQLPPSDLHLSTPKPGVAWLSGSEQNIAANFQNAPTNTYPAYPVFTLDTQDTIHYKIENIVKKNKLGGVWFWELSQDALENPAYSLFGQACKDLGKNGKCILSSAPTSGKNQEPEKCSASDTDCIELSLKFSFEI